VEALSSLILFPLFATGGKFTALLVDTGGQEPVELANNLWNWPKPVELANNLWNWPTTCGTGQQPVELANNLWTWSTNCETGQ
jgi:hypothetical protein